jgi:hypothetical protein
MSMGDFDETHDLRRIRTDLALGKGLGPEDARTLLGWHDALRDRVWKLEESVDFLRDALEKDDEVPAGAQGGKGKK